MSEDLLQIALECAVPLWIERLKKQPLEELLSRGPELAQYIGAHGDKILYKGKRKGETANAFNKLAEAVATLAFTPGGVRVFGLHFKAEHPDAAPEDAESGWVLE